VAASREALRREASRTDADATYPIAGPLGFPASPEEPIRMPDARSIQRDLMAGQRAWADAHGIELAGETSVAHWRDNLLAPIAAESEAELAAPTQPADGSPEKSGRLHTLGSGLVLAVNLLEPWRGRAPELSARLPGWFHADARIRFRVPVPEGLATAAPAVDLDVLIESDGSAPTALIPLFSEPYEDIDPRVCDPFGRDARGFGRMPGCGLLARDLQCHPRRFGRLDVGRVLETALVLDRRFGHHGFRVAVIWFDAGGRASRRFRDEFARVRMRIGGEVDLVEARWQDWFAALFDDPIAGSIGEGGDGQARRIHARYATPTSTPAPPTPS
jgi:hypothetical protein